MCTSYEVGGGFIDQELDVQQTSRRRQQQQEENPKWDTAHYEALLKGGEQVASVLEEMVKLVCSQQFYLSHFILIFLGDIL